MFDKLKGRFEDHTSLSAEAAKDARSSRDSDRRSSKSPARNDYDAFPPATDAPPPFAEGASAGSPPEKTAPPLFSTTFACVSLHMSDRIRLLQLPQQQRDVIRDSILRTWPRGIQKEREYYGAWEFKLNGYPWIPRGEDAIEARRLTRGLLSVMHEGGWVLYVATDVSRNTEDKDNLFFRHQTPPPAPREWFSVTFSKGDRLRLIDAPHSVIEATLAIMRSETQSHGPHKVGGVYELKLNGWPFQSSGGATMVSRIICLKLFDVFEQNGYTMSASLDQKYGGEGTETDTWIVSRPTGWTQGAPVYHQ